MDPSNTPHQGMVAANSLEEVLASSTKAQQDKKMMRPQEDSLKCPRCDSTNTKFCYYNSYSLSQPRYFCKGCKRYWTQGGTLRNVPVGGGYRKNSKVGLYKKLTASSVYPANYQVVVMEEARDRIGGLHDSVLDSILSLLPLKYAIRTSILSRRWIHVWKRTLHHATTFDFGKEFAEYQTSEEFVTTVNKYLQLHNSDKINEFHLYFHPGDDHKADAERWIQFATSKGVNDLSLLFCRELGDYEERIELPETLFGCDSLIHFNISHVDLPSDFTGFSSLVTLRLNRVSITDKTFESILSNCPLLTNLCLRLCSDIRSIKVSGQDLKLKCLSLIATDAAGIDIFAPNLESLHFVGDIFYGYEIRNAASLQDLFLSADGYKHTEPEHDFREILEIFSHVKILTICIAAPMNITIWRKYVYPDALPIYFPNLQELQMLIGGQIGEEYLGYMFGFFEETTFPCLEKLFIDLSGPYDPLQSENADSVEEPSSCVFNNLKSLRISHFRGSDAEMKMVKFFLDRVVSLELLVLVAAPNSRTEKDVHNLNNNGSASRSGASIESMEVLVHQLLTLPKSAHNAQILLFDHLEVDVILTPVHNHNDYYDDGTCCN